MAAFINEKRKDNYLYLCLSLKLGMGIIIRQSIKGSIVTYLGAFLGFITTAVVANYFLTKEQFGLTRVLIEAAIIVSVFAQLGLSSSAIKFFPQFKTSDGRNHGFLFYLFVVPLFGLLIFGLLYVFLKPEIYSYFSKNSALFVKYFYWVIPLAFFITYMTVFETYASILSRIVVPKIIKEIVIRVLTVALFALLFFGFISLNMFVGIFISIYGLAMLLNIFYIFKISAFTLKPNFSFISPELKRKIITYSLFIIGASVGTSIVGKIDIFMISGVMGLGYAAIYSMAYYMASIIEIPSRSILAISYPIVSAAINENNWEKVNDMYKRICLNQLLIGCFIFLVIWVGVDDIFKIIPNEAIYKQGKYVILFIGISKLFDLATGFNSAILLFSRYYYYMLFFIFFLSGLTIATNLWLIPIFGINGSAIATAISILLYNAILTFFIYRKHKSQPFSMNMFKNIVIFALTLGINKVLFTFSNPFIDLIYRVIIASAIYGLLIYFFKISPEFNELLKSSLKKGAIKKLYIFGKK
ncbi:MAG: lipopolysaccharide biosynthesis protein [Bacteroidales bacterium]